MLLLHIKLKLICSTLKWDAVNWIISDSIGYICENVALIWANLIEFSTLIYLIQQCAIVAYQIKAYSFSFKLTWWFFSGWKIPPSLTMPTRCWNATAVSSRLETQPKRQNDQMLKKFLQIYRRCATLKSAIWERGDWWALNAGLCDVKSSSGHPAKKRKRKRKKNTKPIFN